jgi:hypothetical protein
MRSPYEPPDTEGRGDYLPWMVAAKHAANQPQPLQEEEPSADAPPQEQSLCDGDDDHEFSLSFLEALHPFVRAQFVAEQMRRFAAEQELAALRLRLETAEAALHGGAWPIPECLRVLADAADHLLRDHNCDDHGCECVMQARDAARRHVAALSPDQQQPAPGVGGEAGEGGG